MSEETKNIGSKSAKVEILEKRMKANIVLKDAEPDQAIPLTMAYIKSLLDGADIKYGIIEEALNRIVNSEISEERILVAEGRPPKVGVNGSLEYYFPTEKSLKPQISEDGHVDYKEVNLVHSVEKDAPLLRKIPAALGESGTDVHGNLLPGLRGKEVDLVAGSGTYRDQNDAQLIKSSIEGVVLFDSRTNTIEVQKLFIVPGSVDYSTGNIHVKSAVEIKEDVKPGFSVETPYNVDVKGAVENASMNCGGTLRVKDGIKGEGKGLIKVGEDLHTSYIANENVKCAGCIYVQNEIRNSNIECEDEITIVKTNGVIFGGKITATNKIIAATIGNTYNVSTEIEVGIVMKYREQFLKKKAEKAETFRQMEELKKKISEIAQKPDSKAKNLQLLTIKDIWQRNVHQLQKLEKEVKEIEEAYYNVEKPVVIISKTVYPGTIISIKGKSFEVKEELNRVVFSLVDNVVSFKAAKV